MLAFLSVCMGSVLALVFSVFVWTLVLVLVLLVKTRPYDQLIRSALFISAFLTVFSGV